MKTDWRAVADFSGAMLVAIPLYVLARRTGIDDGAVALSVLTAFGVRLMIWANR